MLTGDLETGDAAVTALWLLVRGNLRLLRPDSGALGTAGTDLVKPLREIILGSRSADAVRALLLQAKMTTLLWWSTSQRLASRQGRLHMASLQICTNVIRVLVTAGVRATEGAMHGCRMRTMARTGRMMMRTTAWMLRSCCTRSLERTLRSRTWSKALNQPLPRTPSSRSRHAALSCDRNWCGRAMLPAPGAHHDRRQSIMFLLVRSYCWALAGQLLL